jgi:hypothetical protein
MANKHHICEECESEFTINYDEKQTEDSPHYCPFCCYMILEIEESFSEDDDE